MSGNSEQVKNSIRHNVYALSQLFGVDPTTDERMFAYAEKLEQNMESFPIVQADVQNALDVLCESNPQSQAFLQKYEGLRLRNMRQLAPSVYLYARIKRCPELLETLEHIGLSKHVAMGSSHLRFRSPGVLMERKGVTQLQKLIANSAMPVAGMNHGSSNEFIRGPAVNASLDFHNLARTSLQSSTDGAADHANLSNTVVQKSLSMQSVQFATNRTILKQSPKLPMQPEWLFTRSSLCDDYLPASISPTENQRNIPIQSMSLSLQEHAIVNDLLQCLQGNRGIYLKPVPLHSPHGTRTFWADENMSPALLDTVNKILPLCTDYSLISRFIAEKSLFQYGMVNQALASAIRRLFKDYLILLCQLEHQYTIGKLGVARLQLFLQNTASRFSQLGRIATEINTGRCTGGAVLSLLHDNLQAVCGVRQSQELLSYLLDLASVPFFQILQKWIYRGIIIDPYQEFFIAANPMPQPLTDDDYTSANGDEHVLSMGQTTDQTDIEYIDWAFFWEQQYTLLPKNLPTFLHSHHMKILNTGKYLNVVQKCADGFEFPPMEELEYEEGSDPKYLEQIERAHSFASGLLLKLMVEQNELKGHLKSVKRYFLLDQADFIVHFMDVAAQELCKPSAGVSLFRLSSLLESAIRSSSATEDPFKDNLKVVLFKYDLITQILNVLRAGSELGPDSAGIVDTNLTGVEAFSIDYNVGWPISLVLNRQLIDRYQLLFRHLFYCKHVERLLDSAWVLGKMARKADSLVSTWFTTAFLLGQRMLHFIQHFQYYMTVEVIEPTWQQFFSQLDKMSNLDALLDSHLRCLEVCIDDCLLAIPDLLRLFAKLSVVCVSFSNFAQHVIEASGSGELMLGLGSWDQSLNALDGSSPNLPRSQSPSGYRFTADNHPRTPAHEMPSGVVSEDRVAAVNPICRASLASSIISGDSIWTKVTREDFTQVGMSKEFGRTVVRFDRTFNKLLGEFIDNLKYHAKERNKLASLVSRLDFNEFYSTLPRQKPTVHTVSDDGRQSKLQLFSSSPRTDAHQMSDISTFVTDYLQPLSRKRPNDREGSQPPKSSDQPSFINADPEGDYI